MRKPRHSLLLAVSLVYGCQGRLSPQTPTERPETPTRTQAAAPAPTETDQPARPTPLMPTATPTATPLATATAPLGPSVGSANEGFRLPSDLRPLGPANFGKLNPLAELRFPADGSQEFMLDASADGKTVGVLAEGGQFVAWDLEAGKLLASLDVLPDAANRVTPRLSLSPDGRFAVLGMGPAESGLSVVDLVEGGALRPLEGLEGRSTVDWHFDTAGSRLTVLIGASQVGDVRTAITYDLPEARVVRRLAGQEAPRDWQEATLSTDGRWLAWLTLEGARILDLAGDGPSRRIPGNWLQGALSPSGSQIALASVLGDATVFQVESGEELFRIPPTDGGIVQMTISPDGSYLAAVYTARRPEGWYGRYHPVVVWDLGSRRAVWRFDVSEDEGPRELSFTPDSKVIIVGYMGYYPKLKHLISGAELSLGLWHGPSYPQVDRVAFSHDGTLMLALDGALPRLVWDLAGWGSYYLSDALYLPPDARLPLLDEDRLLASVSDGIVRLWGDSPGYVGYPDTSALGAIELNTADALQVVARYPVSGATDVSYSPDGRRIAVAHEDGKITLLETAESMRRHTLSGHSDWVYEVAFSPDGTRLASASRDGTLRIWDVSSGAQLFVRSEDRGEITAVAYSADGELLATTSQDRQVVVRRAWDGVALRILTGLDTLPWDVSFSPDGDFVAAISAGNELVVWELEQGSVAARTESGQYLGSRVAFSPDGRRLAAGSWDSLTFLEASAEQLERGSLVEAGSKWVVVSDLAFSPGDGAVLAVGTLRSGLGICDVVFSKCDYLDTTGTSTVRGVAFSPDGRLLATVSDEDALRLWGVWP